jgi:radical SAM superfamily enzyme YgiQ (UPF0313 family)
MRARQTRRKGLLLVPEFPRDSFWSYRYIIRLIGRKAAFPPLGLLTFAACLPGDWDLELIDLNVAAPSDRALRRKIEQADVAFVTAMSIQKRSLVQILDGPARGTATPFVLGGPFASSYRDQILEPASASDRILHDGLDVLVWGEAQGSIGPLLEWLDSEPVHDAGRPRLLIPAPVAQVEAGSRRYLNDRSIFTPLESVPLPRWDLVRVRDYQTMMIQTTAGCPFRCDFCDIIQFNGGFNRPKPPAAVRRELDALLATGFRGSVFSVDDNFIGKPDAISVILDEIIEWQREHDYPFSFHTQASVDLGAPKHEHLIGRMRQAGFEAVFLGIENPDEEALRRMNKKQNLGVDLIATVSKIQAAGIEVCAGFIFGSDGDTPSTVDRIVEFARRNRIFTAMAGMLTPVPHTPLWERLRAEGRLRPAEYTGNNTDDEVQFEPRGLSAVQLRAGIHRLVYRLFSPGEAYRRALGSLRVVKPQIFAGRRLRPAYLKAALVSVWAQGIRRLDRDYFSLMWHAARLDQEIRRRSRKQARRLERLARRIRTDADARLAGARESMDSLLEMAHDYRVRFVPEERLDQVRAWLVDVRERLRRDLLSAADVRAVCDQAAEYLRARTRRHRFPGATLAGAVAAAIKSLHYEKVMRAIVDERLLPLEIDGRNGTPQPAARS